MSKIFSKTVKKTTLWSVIVAIVVAAAIVVCALFGFNKNLAMKDNKTLTVSLNAYVYNTQIDTVEAELSKELGAEYTLEGKMSGDVSEIVFVFEKDADVAALKTKAEAYLADKVANAQGWSGAKYNVSASAEVATASLAEGYVLRAAIAGAVLTVLAFVYVAIRYNMSAGITAGVSALVGMLLSAAIIVLTRVYVTASAAYAIAMAGLMTVAMTLFTLNNVRSAKKEGATTEEAVMQSVAAKEVLYTALVIAVGMLLVGILGKTGGAWFAASALIAVAASVLVSLFFAPAVYLSLQTAADGKPAKEGYVGAKKTSTKEKKTYEAKKEEVAPVEEAVEEEPAEEAPVEETEEAPAEEAPVEEAVEETPVEEEPVEEAVEEAPVEEASVEETEEAPAEETPVEEAPAEETVEEKTEE